jgi:hypothetical protein
MAYRFMGEHRGEYTIRETVGISGVSCSAYYRRAKQGISQRRREAGAELADLIRRIQERHHYRYGRVGGGRGTAGTTPARKYFSRL